MLIAPLPWALGREVRVVTALWLVLLWAPLGFYLARGVRGSGRAARPVALIVAASGAALLTAGLTHAAGLLRNHWTELVAAAIAILLGFGAASLGRARPRKSDRPTLGKVGRSLSP